MDVPFVTVIIPVFNDSKRLLSCLRSLYCQIYPYSRYEVIVVDNGSTENIYTGSRLAFGYVASSKRQAHQDILNKTVT